MVIFSGVTFKSKFVYKLAWLSYDFVRTVKLILVSSFEKKNPPVSAGFYSGKTSIKIFISEPRLKGYNANEKTLGRKKARMNLKRF